MFKSLMTTLIGILAISSLFADCGGGSCCQSVDIEVGWRRDYLKWKLSDLESDSSAFANVDDSILFKDINSYMISGQAKWVAADYYVRLSAEYGFTYKGRAHENFDIDSPILFFPVSVDTSDPIKRNSEVYDFDGAVGYPLAFCNCRLSIIPLIGFSFHRQHLRVKHEDECSRHSYGYYNDFYSSSSSSFSSRCSDESSRFLVERSNPFIFDPASNPFSSSSDPNIADELGLIAPHDTSNYRFTWYGFYLGADLAYALDNCWTLFWNTEFHFFNKCHRKRESWTGVDFVDDYHKTGWAYGFNNVVGFNYHICNCWYTTASVDFNWWQADSKHDKLNWKKVGAKIGLVYAF